MADKQYIERGALIDKIFPIGLIDDGRYVIPAKAVKTVIDKAPTADVAPVVHGEWIDRDGKTWCSNCDASNKQYKPPYCPHCGARMDGGKHETD